MKKNAQTTPQLHTSHTLAKLCSKFSKPGFNNTRTMNFQMFKLDLEKAEELYKKDLNDPDNHNGVITHLEPDILECKVKRALGSIMATKLVEVMEFQLSYFRS